MADGSQGLLPWFQMASPVVAAIGIAASTAIALAALRNNRRDQRQRIQPNVLFTPRGETVAVDSPTQGLLPGRDAKEAAEFLAALPEGTTARTASAPFGELKNYGTGPAFDIRLSFRPNLLLTAGSERPLTAAEKALYLREGVNALRPLPAHLAAGAAATLGAFPGILCFLPAGATGVAGRFDISCADATGASVETVQEARFELDASNPAQLTATFGNRPATGARPGCLGGFLFRK